MCDYENMTIDELEKERDALAYQKEQEEYKERGFSRENYDKAVIGIAKIDKEIMRRI